MFRQCADVRQRQLPFTAQDHPAQGAVNIVRAQGVSSISGLSMEGVKRGAPRLFLAFAADQVTLALSTRAGEAARDDWDQRVFGHIPGLLRFSPISQVCSSPSYVIRGIST